MHKYIVISFLLLLPWFGAAESVSAATYSGSCVSLSRDLSQGMRGSDVTDLQRFLVSRNYPGGGSWMITGYFGAATKTAVQNYQREQNLLAVGIVGSATRAAILADSCGSTGYSYVPSYSTPVYNYSYGYTPAYAPTYPATNGNYAYSTYPIYPQAQQQTGPAQITALSKSQGGVGESITIYGSGFSGIGNTVHFGKGVIANVRSLDGTSLSFTVPTQLVGYGNDMVQLASYPVSVTNQNGSQSNSVYFNVTALHNTSITPTIQSVNGPTVAYTGQANTWSLSLYSPSQSNYITASVNWGDEYVYGGGSMQQNYAAGTQTATFSHTYTNPGTYTITFKVYTTGGQSSTRTATVQVIESGAQNGIVSLHSMQPTYGQKGSLVILTGSNFTATDNTIHFGTGGIRNVPTVNGNTLYFTVPHYVSPCDLIVGQCAAPSQIVDPGNFAVYVTNAHGTSNTLTYTVAQ